METGSWQWSQTRFGCSCGMNPGYLLQLEQRMKYVVTGFTSSVGFFLGLLDGVDLPPLRYFLGMRLMPMACPPNTFDMVYVLLYQLGDL